MNVEKLGLKFLLVIIIIVGALLALYPPEKKLKPGIDLAGGTSLLYEIDTTDLAPEQEVDLAERVIEQLRKRVDPNNQRNLVWRPIGNTRIEIQMPSATGAARELREAKDQAIEELMELNLSGIQIRVALERDSEERLEALQALNQNLSSRIDHFQEVLNQEMEKEESERDQKFVELTEQRIAGLEALLKQRAELFEKLATAYEAYRLIRSGEMEGNEISTFQAYETARDDVLVTTLGRSRLIDVLNLDAGPGRDKQIEKLKEKFPAYATGLDEVLKEYDLWAQDRGTLEDPEDLKRLLRGAGVLEFRIMARRDQANPSRLEARNPAYQELISEYVEQLNERGPRHKPGKHYRWFPIQDPVDFLNAKNIDEVDKLIAGQRVVIEKYADRYFVLAYVEREFGLLAGTEDKWKLVSAFPTRDFNTGRLVVNFQLDPRGGDLFGKLTRENLQWQLGIFLDNECISAPNIKSEIHESGVIEGTFTPEEVNYLVSTLEAGSLPARLKEPPLSERSIGSSLGETNRRRGFYAAVIGLIAVAAFILIYYLLCGLVANVALVMNILLVLAAMSVLEATFTLPGIAALILTVGMAVDANVLIFERIREEFKRGSSIKMAVKNGYEKAFSTILDANLTTLITCIILGYAGSEEVKGFAIVLGLGVVFSMFTALFVTRIVLAALIQGGVVKSLPMLRIIGVPNVQWFSMRRFFWPISLVLVIGGAGLFAFEHKTHQANIYDIEFLGGTAVTIELKPGETMSDDAVRRQITGADSAPDDATTATGWLRLAANRLPNMNVSATSQTGVFDLTSREFTAQQLEMMLLTGMSDDIEPAARRGIEMPDSHTVRVTTKMDKRIDQAKFKAGLNNCAEYLAQAAAKLSNAKVVVVRDSAADTFDINTIETNKEVVRQAILAVLGDKLNVQQPIVCDVRKDDLRAPESYFSIYSESKRPSELRLADIIGGDTLADVQGYQGGVAIVFDRLEPPQTAEQLRERLHSSRLLPEFEKYSHRPFTIVGLGSLEEDSGRPLEQRRLTSFALLVADENLNYGDDPEVWENELAKPELAQAQQALGSQKSLQRVSQFAPQVAAQTTQTAIMAILLALVAIVFYIWLRFGNMKFGLAAIVALVHDVTISLGAVAASYYVSNTALGRFLLIDDFKIDLPMIAALLTIVGYSLNDTIVVFDRIRENRGKLKEISEKITNPSLNQTLSRTILTSVTTLLAVGLMYLFGGEGIHGFSFAMIIGVLVGTYSSIAIATPLILHPNLLKWIINLIITLVLVGVALMLDQKEFQVLVWIIAGLFLLFVIVNELRRPRQRKPPFAG